MTETAVKERPILFSGEMVRAILNGRKTQTRRIVNPQPEFGINPCHYSKTGWAETDESLKGCQCRKTVKCPYGIPGERLWVRETFDYVAGKIVTLQAGIHSHKSSEHICYRADGGDPVSCQWSPSIHMPRWASRITLEITDVRVQRLQDISEDDAKAEGVDEMLVLPGDRGSYVASFANLWYEINGDGSWESNPLVWCLTFNKLEN